MKPAYSVTMSLEDYKQYYNYGCELVEPKRHGLHPIAAKALVIFVCIIGKTLIGALI